MITVVLSSVSSPHRLVESVKVAYGFRGVSVDLFIVTRPTGLASQTGVPEAYRVALKYGKPLVVLSSLKEVFEYFKFDEVYSVLPGQSGLRRLEEISVRNSKYALIFTGEEHSRSEAPVEVLTIPELPADSPPQVTIALALYTIYGKLRSSSSGTGGK